MIKNTYIFTSMTGSTMKPSMLTGIFLGPEPPSYLTSTVPLFQDYHLPAAPTYRWKVTP